MLPKGSKRVDFFGGITSYNVSEQSRLHNDKFNLISHCFAPRPKSQDVLSIYRQNRSFGRSSHQGLVTSYPHFLATVQQEFQSAGFGTLCASNRHCCVGAFDMGVILECPDIQMALNLLALDWLHMTSYLKHALILEWRGSRGSGPLCGDCNESCIVYSGLP